MLLNGQKTGQQISGALLEAAIQCQPGYLLFMSDDIPSEDMLSIVLLDTQGLMLDNARLGRAYTTGSFKVLQWQVPDNLKFRGVWPLSANLTECLSRILVEYIVDQVF